MSETSQSVVMHDRFDTAAFHETREQFPPLDEIAQSQALPEAGTFTEDLFCSFYKTAPTLAAEDSLTLTARVRRRLVDEVMNTAEYQRVRAMHTEQDQYSSGMATASTAYQVIDKLDRKTKSRMCDLQRVEAAAQQLFQQAEALEEYAEQSDAAQEVAAEAQDKRTQAEAAQAQAQVTYEQLLSEMEKIEDAARRAARQGLRAAGDEMKEFNDAMEAYGGYSHEQGQREPRMSATQKLELAKKIKGNKKLARIAELAGKMVNTALQKQRNKVIHPPDEIVGVTQGSDLPYVLPHELLLLDDEVTEPLFYQKYVEGELMQFDMIGHEQQAKGAIIGCVDLSGSMDGLLINERRLTRKLKDLPVEQQAEARTKTYTNAYTKEIWSKAVLLALLAIAHHQHRDFCVVCFGSYGEMKVYKFPKAKTTTAELIDLAEFFFGGGTTYDGWMTESLVIAEKGPFENADVIVISDGDVGIADERREEFNTRRSAKKMHCYGVLLENATRAKYTGENMKSVTDHSIALTDLDNDSKVLDMLFNI